MPRTDNSPAYISSTLKGVTKIMGNHERAVAHACFEHYRREWTRIKHEAPERVAYTVHLVVDEQVQSMLATSKHAPDVKCRKGCAACCHMNVDVWEQEAELLWMVADAEAIAVDMERLARQADKNLDSRRELSIEDQRCVFLDDEGACKVYEHRPGACRKYLVKTDPDLCDMNKHPGGKVGIVFSVHAEIAHSAARTVYGGGTMASMLLKTRKGSTKNGPETTEAEGGPR